MKFLSGWVDTPDDLARLEVRKGWWIGAYSVLNGELLFASRSLNALCRKLKQHPGMVWPVGVCSAATREELSLPAPVGQSPEQRPHDWHEELRQAGNMTGDIGFLNFFYAWDAVRQLAQTNDAIEQENRINNLWRTYPEAANKLGLPKPPANNLSQVGAVQNKQIELTEREKKIWEVIQRGSKGLTYCRELESAGMKPRRSRLWQGCPGTYPAAYQVGKPWRHRIQDEKSKIRRKAKLANTRNSLVGE